MRELTYLEAIKEAHFEEMARDPRVFVIGEDVGQYGGAFKVTQGLLERFGRQRVVDTPIAESMIMGVSIGAAIRGLRPIAEMQFADFVTCGFSQLVANAATFHYRLEVSVPMVVRLPAGGGVGGGPYHSRNPEAWFTHSPGIKVVAPATPADAKGLLIAAIRDPDPVIYLEQKWLYRREKGPVPEGEYVVPLGKARVARGGQHATLVAYANAVPMAIEAAERVSKEGFEVEVIDLRTLVPWDWQTVLTSVEKTGRLLLASEATRTSGFVSEVAATVADLGFESLDAPILRVTALDSPTPAEKGMEDYFRPNADKVERALRALLAY
ncbi:MAG: alpha-ketoacid dehydrogenase subunit beta [Deltaproteobacteria bacterium]|nr:alpha-ketoacid dehydrogenase subunit beta [Deltaproteobacteria bacterium]